MSAADPAAALCAYLAATVGSQCSGRIFRPRLPKAQNGSMPRACIVVTPAGGYALMGASDLQVGDPRLDVRCYGETELQAQSLARSVLLAVKDIQREVYEGVLLHWGRPSGLIPMVEPDTAWPLAIVPCQIAHAEQSVG